MRAIRRNHHQTSLDVVPIPSVAAHEALVRVECVGVCRTDLHVARGRVAVRAPLVLGHELAGTLSHGAPVSVVPWLACEHCATCSAGASEPPRCDRPAMLGVDRDGAFADYVVVPKRSLLPLPSHLSWRRAAFVEPLAAAMAVRNAPIRATQRGFVHGRGRIGELTARVLRAAGFEHVATRADGTYDFVVDTEGTPASLREAMQRVTIGGMVILKSRPFAPIELDVALAVRREIALHAVHYGSFREAVSWLVEDRIEVDDLFDEPAPLEDFAQVFEHAEQAHSKKQFFSPSLR